MDRINEKVMHKVTVADKVSLDRLHKGDLPSEKEAFQRQRYGTINHKGGMNPKGKANWRGIYVCLRQCQSDA